MAHDPQTGQTVLFGGFVRTASNDCVLGDTWVWDGRAGTWTEKHPATTPVPRYGHVMASAAGGIVLFGGYDGGRDLDDTWTWDGSNWTRRDSPEAPSPRARSAMAYDEERDQAVLFGGDHNGAVLGDTWLWDGSSWKRRTSTVVPDARGYASMAYHAASRRVLLRGGWNGHGLSDAWTWDGTEWKREAGAHASMLGAMAYHRDRGWAVFEAGTVGAFYGDGSEYNDRLEDSPTSTPDVFWDGSAWRTRCTGSLASLVVGVVTGGCTGPPLRVGAVMAEDSAGNLVFFGGYDQDGTDKGDTWTFVDDDPLSDIGGVPGPKSEKLSISLAAAEILADGKATTTVTATVTRDLLPVSGYVVQLATDGDVVIEPPRGVTDSGGRFTATITASNTPGFEAITAKATEPGVHPTVDLFTDLVRNTAGASRWTGEASTGLVEKGMTLTLTPLSIEPDGTATSTAVANVFTTNLDDEQVCFATDGDVTFRLADGSTPASSPDGYCGTRGGEHSWQITIVASNTPGVEVISAHTRRADLTATALLDEGGREWLDRSKGPAPGRENAAMAHDQASGLTVLFGGYYGEHSRIFYSGSPQTIEPAKVLADTWAWDGATWMKLTTPDGRDIPGPTAREGAAMAYDASSGRLILFGGHDGTRYLNDTWSFDGTTKVWTQLHPSTAPPPRYAANMAPDGQGVVLFSGTDGFAYDTNGPTDPNGRGHLRDTWTWRDGMWTEEHPPQPPAPRESGVARFANDEPVIVPLPPPPPGCPPEKCPPDKADPYPSSITVTGVAGKVTDLKLTLKDLSWPQGATGGENGPADADIMLVGPSGRAVMVMSDACGQPGNARPIGLPGVTITIEGSAASPLPTSEGCTTGSYRPTDIETPECTPFHGPDAFPPPAPAGTHSADLADLRGSEPNGTWSLFVVDDCPNHPNPSGAAGRISGGWGIEIFTTDEELEPALVAAAPPARGRGALAYHPPTGKVVLFGGTQEFQAGSLGSGGPPSTNGNAFNPLADTWAWDPLTRTWAQQGIGDHPGPRRSAAMAYHPGTGQLMLFGGSPSFYGRVAEPTACPTNQSPSDTRPEAIDTYCVNDYQPLSDTWTWNGQSWARQSPVMSPVGDRVTGMATDAGGRPVLVLGLGAAAHTYTWQPRVVLRLDRQAVSTDGTSPVHALATVTDESGRPVPGLKGVKLVSDGDSTFSEITDQGNGTYTATITASRTPGIETVTVRTPIGWAASTIEKVGEVCSMSEATEGAGRWSTDGLPDLPTPRTELAAAKGSDGRLYAFGGRTAESIRAGYPTFDTVEAYDPCTNTWLRLPPMPSGPRAGLAAAGGADGRIYVVGGYFLDAAKLARTDVYTPGHDGLPGRWETLPDLPMARSGAAAVVNESGDLVVTGGMWDTPYERLHTLDTTDVYSPGTGKWLALPAMSKLRYQHASAIAQNGRVLVMGGVEGQPTATGPTNGNTAEAYSERGGSWRALPPMLQSRRSLAAAADRDGIVYAINGALSQDYGSAYGPASPVDETNGRAGSVEAYVGCVDSWVQVAPMAGFREQHAAVTGPDGRIFVLGGSGPSPSTELVARVEAYTPTPETKRSLCPTADIGDVTVREARDLSVTATFTVTLDRPADLPASVHYETADVSATSGSDYASASGDLFFRPGETSRTVDVPVLSDNEMEPTETFNVRLSVPPRAADSGPPPEGFGALWPPVVPPGTPLVVLGKRVGIGTILDAPLPQLSIGDATVAEAFSGTVPATFTLTLSEAARAPVSVDYATADGTATGGSDYAPAAGRVDIPAGASSATVAIPVAGDTAAEGTEQFSLSLSSPIGGSLTRARATATVLDAVGGLSVGDSSVVEGDSLTTPANFTVTLAGPATEAVSVDYATADASATAPYDYLPAAGTLRFEAGERSKIVTVDVVGDFIVEDAESFTLNLSNPAGAPLARERGTATVLDDDANPPTTGDRPPPGPQPASAQPPSGSPSLPAELALGAAASAAAPSLPSPPERPNLLLLPPASVQTLPNPLTQAQPQAQHQIQQQQAQQQAQSQAQHQVQVQAQAQVAAQAGMMAERQRENEAEKTQVISRDASIQTHLASARDRRPPSLAPVLGWVTAIMAGALALTSRSGAAAPIAVCRPCPGRAHGARGYNRHHHRRRP